jgi:HAMP domain-containing protein
MVAAIFMRNQVRALRKISAAAEAFGMGRTVGPMKPEGAAEVRQTATAFNRMEERIRRFVDSRTEMLAGISHDLRTPLTRLRLGLAMLPEAARDDATAMTEDVEEMDRLIGDYLAFARGEGVEQSEETDLAALLRDVVARQSRGGIAIPFDGPDALPMELRAGAMRRCFGNLLDNARKHAKRVAVTLTQEPASMAFGPKSRLMMTGQAFRKRRAKMPSSHLPALPVAVPGLALPLRAILPARMAAMFSWKTARWVGYGRVFACRADHPKTRFATTSSFASNSGSRFSGAVISAYSSARSQPAGQGPRGAPSAGTTCCTKARALSALENSTFTT